MVRAPPCHGGGRGFESNRGSLVIKNIWLLGQAVKTSPFHGGNTGSIPVGVTKNTCIFIKYVSIIYYMAP